MAQARAAAAAAKLKAVHVIGMGAIGKLVAHQLRRGGADVRLLVRASYAKTAGEIGYTVHARHAALHASGAGDAGGGQGVHASGFKIESTLPLDAATAGVQSVRASQQTAAQTPHAARDISTLIVCTKAQDAAAAVASVRHRLAVRGLVVVLCNGWGVAESISCLHRPAMSEITADSAASIDPAASAATDHAAATQTGDGRVDDIEVVEAITSHGAHHAASSTSTPRLHNGATSEGRLLRDVVHAGMGTILISPLPTSSDASQSSTTTDASGGAAITEGDDTPSARLAALSLALSPLGASLAASGADFKRAQLRKLVVNAVLNPLTALADVRNGLIVADATLSRLAAKIVIDVHRVLAEAMPEHVDPSRSVGAADLAASENKFSHDSLDAVATYLHTGDWPKSPPHADSAASGARDEQETRLGLRDMASAVRDVALATGANISSTLQDVRAGRVTELAFINGAIDRLDVQTSPSHSANTDAAADAAGAAAGHEGETLQRALQRLVDHRLRSGSAPPDWQKQLLALS